MLKIINNDFLYFRLNQSLVILGGKCTFIAFSWWLIPIAQSEQEFSVLIMTYSLVNIIFIPVFSPFGDIYARKKCVFWANMWSLLALIILTTLVLCKYYNLYLYTAFIGCFALGTALSDAVSISIMPMLVSKHQMPDAVRFYTLMQAFAISAGAMLAGAISSISLVMAMLINLFLLFLGAVFVLQIRANTKSNLVIPKIAWYSNIKEGVSVFLKLRLEFVWSIIGGIINFCLTPFLILLMPLYVKNILHMPVWYYGIINASLGFGIFLGAYYFVKVLSQLLTSTIVTLLGISLLGSAITCFSIETNIFILPIYAFVMGMGMSMHNINATVYRIVAIPNSYRVRITSIGKFIFNGFSIIGLLLIGLLIKYIKIKYLILFLGLIIICLSPMLLFIPEFISLMHRSSKDREEYYKILYPEAFS